MEYILWIPYCNMESISILWIPYCNMESITMDIWIPYCNMESIFHTMDSILQYGIHIHAMDSILQVYGYGFHIHTPAIWNP